MTGRPSSYTPEIADAICGELADGKSLRSICAKDDMPDRSTVFRWLRENDAFRDQYARACEERGEALAEEIVDIADLPPAYKTTAEGTSIDAGDVANRKLQIDARKWIASKLKPKKYGDKLELAGNAEQPLTVQVVKLTEAAP